MCLENGEEAKWLEQLAEVRSEREGGQSDWGHMGRVLNSDLRT